MAGANALWKNAQKIARKNKPSETMNKATPIFKPLCTAKVWLPKYVPSDITSLNQNDIENIKLNKAIDKKCSALSKPCIVNTPTLVKVKSDTHVKRGQGEGETRWKGWAWKLLRVKFVMIFFNSYWLCFFL